MTLASKSIFGKGDLEHMPFEQFGSYVASQGYNLNNMITEMRFDPDSDTAKLFFKPVAFLTEQDWETAKRQGASMAAKKAIEMSVPKTDSAPKLAAPKAEAEDPRVEVAEPKKRPEKKATEPTAKKDVKSILSSWSTDDA